MKELLDIAIRASLAAGRDILSIYDDPAADFGIERKADNSPLTRADKAAHARIMTFLEPTGIPVLSEEGAHLPYEERRHWQRLWIVDPLDGTKEFIKRNGEFTVNIALVENGSPVLGVIYRPTPIPSRRGRGEAGALYFGSKETGAWLTYIDANASADEALLRATLERSEALPLTGERGESPRPFVCVASRSHLSPETAAFIDDLRREHPDLELVSSGSSLKICLVAEGAADIYPRHAPTMEWDTAAGHAIAIAAGHEMIDAHTLQPLRYNKEDLHNPWFIVR
ncbi:MAG: 3'(2'),5'-bisphosphate nucleotidase CysQ [Bacteroidaceae bacterium]|nr:3'(2'),5'-bisphosphate nucleotidase CysQ [Bacteroidaceae bacterium]